MKVVQSGYYSLYVTINVKHVLTLHVHNVEMGMLSIVVMEIVGNAIQGVRIAIYLTMIISVQAA